MQGRSALLDGVKGRAKSHLSWGQGGAKSHLSWGQGENEVSPVMGVSGEHEGLPDLTMQRSFVAVVPRELRPQGEGERVTTARGMQRESASVSLAKIGVVLPRTSCGQHKPSLPPLSKLSLSPRPLCFSMPCPAHHRELWQ